MVSVPLVLHGGTGIFPGDLKAAVKQAVLERIGILGCGGKA